MIRSFRPEPFDLIANSPGVREWIGGVDYVETAPLVIDPANFCFLTKDQKGYFVYIRTGDGVYDVHCGALPEGRNRQMLEAREDSLRWMFAEGARKITTIVPDRNRGALVYARQAGFKLTGRAESALDVGGKMVGVSYYELTHQAWLDRAARRG